MDTPCPDYFKFFCEQAAWRSVAALLTCWVIIFIAFYAVALTRNFYVGLGAFLVIAVAQNSLLTLTHEAWHFLLFKKKSWNHLAGTLFASYLLGSPYYLSMEKHLNHHRLVGKCGDPKLPNLGHIESDTQWHFLKHFMSIFMGGMLVTIVMRVIHPAPRGDIGTGMSRKGLTQRQEFLALVSSQFIFFIITLILFRTYTTYCFLWILPLLTLTPFLQAVRQFVEHTQLAPVTSKNPRDHYFSIRCSAIEQFFFAPFHFNYHFEHHEFPMIPYFNLHRLKPYILEDPKLKPYYKERWGYFPFLVKYFKLIGKN